MGDILHNKPLIEAILEMKWKLPLQKSGIFIDPNYKVVIGLYYNSIKKDFPFWKDLPTATAPEEILPYNVQYQFRTKEEGWPLTQIGPGILTVNDTEQYSWENNFKKNCINLLETFKNCYPKPEELEISELQLRYINAVEVDFKKENIYDFLSNKLNLHLQLPEGIKKEKTIDKNPNGINIVFNLSTSNPKGSNIYRISKGKKNKNDAIVFELLSISKSADISKLNFPFTDWLEAAHDQIETSFLSFTKGDLYRSFKNE